MYLNLDRQAASAPLLPHVEVALDVVTSRSGPWRPISRVRGELDGLSAWTVSAASQGRRLDRRRGCSHLSRDNGQWSSSVTEDGLDRHAAGGDFELEIRERDCARKSTSRVYNDGFGGWKWEMSI